MQATNDITPEQARRTAVLEAGARLGGLEHEREAAARRLGQIENALREARAEYRAAVQAEWQAHEPACEKAMAQAPVAHPPEPEAPTEPVQKKPKKKKARPCCPICAKAQDDPRANSCHRCTGAQALYAGDSPNLSVARAWRRADGTYVLRAKQWPFDEAGHDEEALGKVASNHFGTPLSVAVVATLEEGDSYPVVIELAPAEAPAPSATGDLFPDAGGQPAGASHLEGRL